MATIRFASPWTQGLAVGLPAAATAFTQAYESALQRAEREQDRALRQQLFLLQMQQAEREAQRFQVEQGERTRLAALRAQAPGLLQQFYQGVYGTPPTFQGSIPPAGAEAEMGEPGTVIPGQPAISPQSLAAGLVSPGLFQAQTQLGQIGIQTPSLMDLAKETEKKENLKLGQALEQEALEILLNPTDKSAEELASAAQKYGRAKQLQGQPTNLTDLAKFEDKVEVALFNEDMQFLSPYLDKLRSGEMTSGDVGEFLNALRNSQSKTARQFAFEDDKRIAGTMTGPAAMGARVYAEILKTEPDPLKAYALFERQSPVLAQHFMPSDVKLMRERLEAGKKARVVSKETAIGKGEGEKKVWGPTGKPSTPAATKTIVDLAIQNAKTLWPDNVLRQQAFAEWMKTREEELSGKSLKDIEDKIRQGIAEVEGRHPAPASQAATPEASRGLWQKIRDLFTGRPAPPPAPMAPPANMPDPSAHPGETIRHKPTGKMYRSDGTQWTEVSP